MPEVVCTLGFGEGVKGISDLLLQAIDAALCSASDHGLEFCERVLDQVLEMIIAALIGRNRLVEAALPDRDRENGH